ncbi:hypothetical protein FQN60_017970 [Etheostoma spectabile]|uniref:Uncharacterized protein n=1 Tax=Etheostoma spectabile TaxID=54343 RepID=A0A5J5DGP2_9PERO|nr:hypothetical protein FQN60_017970 [Etheostoma spectabile]
MYDARLNYFDPLCFLPHTQSLPFFLFFISQLKCRNVTVLFRNVLAKAGCIYKKQQCIGSNDPHTSN